MPRKHPELGQSTVWEGIASSLSEKNPRAAAELVERMMTDSSNLSEKHLLNLSPEERAHLVTALQAQSPDEETVKNLQEYTAQIANKWSNQVPEEAARWVESLPPGAPLTGAAPQVATIRNRFDPTSARQWANVRRFPPPPCCVPSGGRRRRRRFSAGQGGGGPTSDSRETR